MTIEAGGLLFVAGTLSAAVNAVAGGGSLISFPALVFTGLPDTIANATNTIAQWPGSLVSAYSYRDRLPSRHGVLAGLLATSTLGGIIGAWLLLSTPNSLFQLLVPVLVLVAVGLLAMKQPSNLADGHFKPSLALGLLVQLLISIYGGYFGAGMGIMMLAAYRQLLPGDTQQHNAIKNLVAVPINLAAAVFLTSQGAAHFPSGGALLAGTLVGGFFGVRYAKRLPSELMRKLIIGFGLVMVAVFTIRASGTAIVFLMSG